MLCYVFLQAVKGNMYKECYVILRKILRVVEALPLTADDVHSKRSAHGTFANVLQELSAHQVCVCVSVHVRVCEHVCALGCCWLHTCAGQQASAPMA